MVISLKIERQFGLSFMCNQEEEKNLVSLTYYLLSWSDLCSAIQLCTVLKSSCMEEVFIVSAFSRKMR